MQYKFGANPDKHAVESKHLNVEWTPNQFMSMERPI